MGCCEVGQRQVGLASALLCAHLLRQGYVQSQITVLATYVGQVILLRKLMKEGGLVNVHLSTVDNYQGEENDIILLSLVRSNPSGKLGRHARPRR